MIKICKLCGKEFETTTPRVTCFDQHYRICPICGKEFEIFYPYPRKCCSDTCSRKLRKLNAEKTCLEQYGMKNSGFSKESQTKIKKSNLAKYGTEWSFQSDEVKSKIRNTLISRYGVDNPQKSKEIKDKTRDTVLQRYGCESTFSYNSPIRAKFIEEGKKLYGNGGYGNSPQAIEKRIQTNLNTFGTQWPSQNAKVRTKVEQTCLTKYGAKSPFESDEVKSKIQDTIRRKYGVKSIMHCDVIKNTLSESVYNKYGVRWSCMLPQCVSAKGCRISKINMQFGELLKSYNIEHTYEFPLENKQYDFKVGNTLIEIDPTYTHSGYSKSYYGKVSSDYHVLKSNLAEKHGFRCIHVFDWDDWDKIINLLDTHTDIYARKCTVVHVDEPTLHTFINTYHIQNTCKNQKIQIGLYYGSELVQVMTFGQPRYNRKYQWELLRLCTKSGYRVIGGASKLFKYFIRNYSPKSIISYCDLSKFSGRVYEQIGMKLHHVSEPSKIWSKNSDKITDNLLRQRGFDQLFKTNFGKGVSNEQLMLEHGWLPVYDCGQAVYEWSDINV